MDENVMIVHRLIRKACKAGYSYADIAKHVDMDRQAVYIRHKGYVPETEPSAETIIAKLENMMATELPSWYPVTAVSPYLHKAVMNGYSLRMIGQLLEISHEHVRNIINADSRKRLTRDVYTKIMRNIKKLEHFTYRPKPASNLNSNCFREQVRGIML